MHHAASLAALGRIMTYQGSSHRWGEEGGKVVMVSCMQVYLTALEVAFKRDMGVSAEVRALAKRIAGFHSGFVADAAASAAKIVQGGMAFAFQVGHPSWHACSCST